MQKDRTFWTQWLPPSALAAVLVLAVALLPDVTSWLRTPAYRLWTSLSQPLAPPTRVVLLTLEMDVEGQVHPRLRDIMRRLSESQAALVALEGKLLGWNAQSPASTPPLSLWLPQDRPHPPLVLGYPWEKNANQGGGGYPGKGLRPPEAEGMPGLPPIFLDQVGNKGQAGKIGISPDRRRQDFPDRWAGRVTVGFLEPENGNPLMDAALLQRLPQGLTPSLGVEALRRALNTPLGLLPYYDAMGYVLGKNLVLPADGQGRAPLRLYSPEGFKAKPAEYLLSGDIAPQEIRGNLVFLAEAQPSRMGYAGPLSLGEIAATQAANLLGRHVPASPASAHELALFSGLVFALSGMAAIIWFGKGMGGFMALGMALLYPCLSLIFFLASGRWLPPEMPVAAVIAASLPLLIWPRPKAGTRAKAKTSPKAAPKAEAPLLSETVTKTTSQTQVLSPPPAPPSPPTPPVPKPRPEASGKPAGDIDRDAGGNLQRIGKYKILRKMGQGSAGEVYEAVDLQMGRKVALKTMIATASLHFDRAFERFLVEARAAGSLNHPHINTIHDFGTADQISYMVLEYLDGVTLSHWMKTHPLPGYSRVATWVEQIASALDYAHAHKVIHRDLKPSNLMVVMEGNAVKLLDFGVAKYGDVMLTQTGMTVGTPTYMSPEQLQGLRVGPASDQYTLAVLVYQMLTHRLPYLGHKIPEICNRILKAELTPIREYLPDIPANFWEAMTRAFSREPEERYPSCVAFYHALEAAMAGLPAAGRKARQGE